MAVAAQETPAPTVVERHWTLMDLDGMETGSGVGGHDPGKTPYIYLQQPGDKLSGSGGCNRLFGSFDLSGSSLQFHSVAATRMACGDDSDKYEMALLAALKLTDGFRVQGDVLELRAGDRVLARFRAGQ